MTSIQMKFFVPPKNMLSQGLLKRKSRTFYTRNNSIFSLAPRKGWCFFKQVQRRPHHIDSEHNLALDFDSRHEKLQFTGKLLLTHF